MRYKIPKYAKEEAMAGLNFNSNVSKSRKVGLSKSQAKKLGIKSGVVRAKQLIRNKTLSYDDIKSIASFYNRFKKCKTIRCEMALSLWGGRKFGKKAVSIVKLNK